MGVETNRREDLLNAAVRVFLHHGYSGASVRQITDAAGCATGTFYLYFPSKEDCFQALIDRLYEAVLTAVVEARASEHDVLAKLWVSIGAARTVFADERDLASVVLLQGPGAAPAFRDRLQRVRLTLAELIAEDLIEAGMDGWSAQCAARTLAGALGEVMVWQAGERASRDQFLAAGTEVRTLFWRGCGFPPEGGGVDSERIKGGHV